MRIVSLLHDYGQLRAPLDRPTYRPAAAAVVFRLLLSCEVGLRLPASFERRVIAKTIVEEIALIAGPAVANDRRARARAAQSSPAVPPVKAKYSSGCAINWCDVGRIKKERRGGFVPGEWTVSRVACRKYKQHTA